MSIGYGPSPFGSVDRSKQLHAVPHRNHKLGFTVKVSSRVTRAVQLEGEHARQHEPGNQ